jgi:plastocyanin
VLRVAVVTVALAALLHGATGSARTATPATTGVDPLITLSVRITDSSVTVKPKRVARLETAEFRVVNAGRQTHDFHVGGLKTKALKHGEVAHVLLQFAERGTYLYRCKLHCSARMRGYITVYSPIG